MTKYLHQWDYSNNEFKVILDFKYNILFSQDGLEALLGFSKEEFLSTSMLGFLNPLYEKEFKNTFEKLTDVQVEIFEFLHVNEEPRWLEFNIKKIDSDQVYLIKIRNVTAYQFQLVELKTKNLRLRNILESAEVGSWDWYLRSGHVHFDERWCSSLGITEKSILKNITTLENRIHPDDREKVFKDITKCLEGEKRQFENMYRILHENGSWIWVLDKGRVTEFDTYKRPLRITGTFFDMTSFKDAEYLSQSIQKMAKIGAWEYNLSTGVTSWSDEVFNIYNFPAKTSAIPLNNINHFSLLDHEKLTELIELCKFGHAGDEVFEFIDAVGKFKWVEVRAEPVFDSHGKVFKILGTIQDISEKVVIEEIAKNEKSKALQSAKLASLGEMSAGIAHEINNPLAMIASSAGTIMRYKDDSEKFARKIDTIVKATMRISKIVNGLRKFSRSSAVKEYKIHQAKNIISEALMFTEIKSNRFSTPVSFEGFSESSIYCDEIEIGQVFINLINNGIDAVKDTEERWVKVSLLENKNEVIIQVRDSGKGIPDHVVKKLFQPFFTTKVVGEGTGLGLSIVKGILDEHKATIEVLSNDTNTCFEVRFKKVASSNSEGVQSAA